MTEEQADKALRLEFALDAIEGTDVAAQRELLELVHRLPEALPRGASPAGLRAKLLAETSRAPERYALRFDRAQMSLDAATQGLGVALESATNAERHLAEGRLKPAFGMDKAIKVKAHFVVYPARHARRPAVEAFLAWIHGEAAAAGR